MNIITGQIEEISVNDGMTMGKVSVRGSYIKVPLTFLMSAKVGDTVVIESGVAISKSEQDHINEKSDGGSNVFGDSRKSVKH